MISSIKKPWFGPAKRYRGLKITSWQGAIVSLLFFAVMYADIGYVTNLVIKIVGAVFAVLAFGYVVRKTADLSTNIVF